MHRRTRSFNEQMEDRWRDPGHVAGNDDARVARHFLKAGLETGQRPGVWPTVANDADPKGGCWTVDGMVARLADDQDLVGRQREGPGDMLPHRLAIDGEPSLVSAHPTASSTRE
jgi:hypothetical protein